MTATASQPILDYAQAPLPRWSRWGLIAWIATLPALVVPFIEFVWGTSPLDAAVEPFINADGESVPLALLGFGFFTAWPAIAWRALPLLGREPGSRARRAFIALAAVGWLAAIWLHVWTCREVVAQLREGDDWKRTLSEAHPYLLAIAVSSAGLLLASRLLARGHRTRALTVVLTTPYLATAALCLTGFASDDPSLGYLLTLLVALTWLSQTAAEATFAFRRR